MKLPTVLLNLVDYDCRYKGLMREGRFYIYDGDKSRMKKTASGMKSSDSYVHDVCETWLRGRYVHCACIQWNPSNISVSENIIRDFRTDFEGSVISIIDYLTDQYPDTVIVNSVVRDIWLHGGAEEFIATEKYQPLFERMGFRDCYGKVMPDGSTLPYRLMVYVQNFGGNGIIDNFKDWF